MFDSPLTRTKLKFNRDSKPRTLYSLRHTYICLRLMEGTDIYQIAKNCRTSVELIEKHYAAHIKSTLDAAAINIRKPRVGTPNPPLARAERPSQRRGYRTDGALRLRRTVTTSFDPIREMAHPANISASGRI
ncbi:MAG TPA: hypothetical protein VG651_08270 [Stellaceae bacterium]|nr:hypothetical protein [Stellaceae bacterium]